jgi:O-acetyl-ADP-ribose deacetylase (regulator of RNase III)
MVSDVSPAPPSPQVQFGTTTIRAIWGDITEQAVDALLNSANTHMILGSRQSVAGMILSKTGEKIADVLSRVVTPVALGDVVVTEGLNLPCKHILHIATHGTPDEERILGDDDLTKLRLKPTR